MSLTLRICLCLIAGGITLFLCIELQNNLTELRMQIPLIAKELKSVQEQNQKLLYEIERFESPIHLMELAKKPEFGHLKHPFLSEVLIVNLPKEDEL